MEWPSRYTVCDTGTLHGFKGAVNRWLLPSHELCFLQFSVAQVLVGFINNLFFPTLACAAGFNNNNNNK